MDLNGPASGLDFAVDRVDANGLVSIVSHGLLVSDLPAGQLSSATITITSALSGDVLGVLTHGTNISQSYADGVLRLTGADSVAHYQQVLRTARFNSTATRAVGDTVNIDFVVNDGSNGSAVAHSVVTTVAAGTATVAARHIFYNDSSFDGNDPAANAADDLAIATDKQVLPFDQTATQANYSNYSRGLNGVMVDIAGPHGTITVEDFAFQVGNNNLPDTWNETPAPVNVITRAGAGQNGSDRVEITWADGAISNEWLEVVVAANRDTGLTKPDTFYFGNAVGESGDSSNDAQVKPSDALRVVNRLLGPDVPAAIDDPLDFNRDQSVNAQDALMVINHLIAAPPDLQLINVASIVPAQINSTLSYLYEMSGNNGIIVALLIGSPPEVDLNGPAVGLDFAVDRVDANGLVSIVSHSLQVLGPLDQLSSATITITNTLSGDVLGVLTHGTNISQSYADGVLRLTGTDSVAHYQQVLRTARFNSTATRAVGDTVNIDFVVNDGSNDSPVAHSVVTTVVAGTATVAGRDIFYNDSSFDGNDPAANAADDLAIATDKQVLPFDQTATQANYSNYSRGLNGVMVDIAGPHGTIGVEDFIFQVGNNNLPDTWGETPAPVSVITRAGAGQNGSDRVEITWADGAISNEWLEVVVAANRDTGLTKPDTFYFGNAVGESGDSSSDARVKPFDAVRVINRLLGPNTPAAIDDPLDFNRDQSVSAQDALVVINRLIAAPPDLQLINVASIAPAQINFTTSTLMSIAPNYGQGYLIQWISLPNPIDSAPAAGDSAPTSAAGAGSPTVLDPQAVAAAFAAPTASLSAKPAGGAIAPSPDATLEWLDPFGSDS